MKQIKFLGAAGMVTGSCYELTSGSGQKILIDMGMFQGTAEEATWNYQPLQFDPATLTGIILTHAHLDHCGRLPMLARQGFNGKIFMTPPTSDLAQLIWQDSAKIRKDSTRKPLYTEDDAALVTRYIQTVPYHQEFHVGDFTITFYDAGHLLGSASLEIVDRSSTNTFKKIIFSGDLGNTPQLVIRPTEYLRDADAVVMESTYGDKTHPEESPLDIIASEIEAVEQMAGTLLIPAFALERTQDILVIIGELIKQKRVSPDTLFFLDSPMAIRATDIYMQYPDFFNEETKKRIRFEDPFAFPGLEIVEDYKFSLKIKRIKGAKVIIAGSGMMTGGRILSHAAEFLPKKTTRLLLVGYQGEETLGREIIDGAKRVQIEKRFVTIHAQINETQALSSHADQPRLMNWLSKIAGVKHVFLTHGDEMPRQVLAQKIKADLGISNVHTPKMDEIITMEQIEMKRGSVPLQ